jgi:hypothetical protein
MKPLFIQAVGCCAPGLDGWANAQPVLCGERPYQKADLLPHASQRLPANERRRAPLAVRLAFCVAEDALGAEGGMAGSMATVFASSDGDTSISHRISLALAEPQRVVSPTDFHNSVHNAAAGYWSIASGSRLPSVSLSAFGSSFAAGLLEAAGLVVVEDLECLLVAFDVRPPESLAATCAVEESAAFALVLSPRRTPGALACLRIEPVPRLAETRMNDAAMETLRRSSPAGRALALLGQLARRERGTVRLDVAQTQSLQLDLVPL